MDEEDYCYCHYHNDTYEYFDCLDYMECEECPYYYADEDQVVKKWKKLTSRIQKEKDMNKANKILNDIICIVAIIIFPMWILKLLGYDKLVR